MMASNTSSVTQINRIAARRALPLCFMPPNYGLPRAVQRAKCAPGCARSTRTLPLLVPRIRVTTNGAGWGMDSSPRRDRVKTLSKSSKKIRVLVVDDHPVVRRGLVTYLAERPHLMVVGEAADGEEALRKTAELHPDIVLADINMPRMDGLQVTEELRRTAPDVHVVILSVHNKPEYVQRVMKAGARGYVLKDTAPDELVRVLESVHAGNVVYSPQVAQTALNRLVVSGGASPNASWISQREREVLVMIAGGQSNKAIATKLGVSVRTIETHRERIMRKLNLHSVAALTRFAIAQGLVSLEDEPRT
jgi:DNA-binding NarL/FixJ family response regulator